MFISLIDHLIVELDGRYHSYKDFQQTFGFLNKIPSISVQDLDTGAANLLRKYTGDPKEDFVDEIGQFKEFIKENEYTSARSLLHFIRERRLQSLFPNVDLALRLFMTLPATSAGGSF